MLPFYATCLFGALEFTQIFYDRLQLNNTCREAARRMAVGKTIAAVKSTIRYEAVGMGITDEMITLEYNDAEDGSGNWVAAADDAGGTQNGVATGHLCRVQIVNWPHPMKTGAFFRGILGSDGATFPMSALEISVRE
jgi:Flp pilus assembly protein TadG